MKIILVLTCIPGKKKIIAEHDWCFYIESALIGGGLLGCVLTQ